MTSFLWALDCHTPQSDLCHFVKWPVPVQRNLALSLKVWMNWESISLRTSRGALEGIGLEGKIVWWTDRQGEEWRMKDHEEWA